jgi:hypothetical protein
MLVGSVNEHTSVTYMSLNSDLQQLAKRYDSGSLTTPEYGAAMVAEYLGRSRLEYAARLCKKYGCDLASFPQTQAVADDLYKKKQFVEILRAMMHVGDIAGYKRLDVIRVLHESGASVSILKAKGKYGLEVSEKAVAQTLEQRVTALLAKGAFKKAVKACRLVGVHPDSIPAIEMGVEAMLKRKQAHQVLAAMYACGTFGRYSVSDLRIETSSNHRAPKSSQSVPALKGGLRLPP